MARRSRSKHTGFIETLRDPGDYLIAPDAKTGRPGLFEAYSENDEPLIVKEWKRAADKDDADLQEIWHHELRQLHRLGGYPNAVETIAPLHSAGIDSKGFYLALAPGERRPLQLLIDRAPGSHWLRQHRSPGPRARIWRNLKRLAAGLETLHVQGLLHRNIDGWAVLTTGSDEPDFLLTGFEWSMRIMGATPTPRRRAATTGEMDSFSRDWSQFGELAATLLGADRKRLADKSIIPSAVSGHLPASEVRLLRELLYIDVLDRLDGELVALRIDEIVGSLGAEAAGRDAKLHLVFRLAPGAPITDRIRREDPDIEANDLIAQFDWIRADLAEAPLLLFLRTREEDSDGRLVLRGHRLCYSLKPYQINRESSSSWDFALCESVERDAPVPFNLLGQQPIPVGMLELMTQREARERFPRLRGKLRSWDELRRRFLRLTTNVTEEDLTHRAFVLTQFIETLLAATDVFPIDIVKEPSTLANADDQFRLKVRTRVESERDALSDALGLRRPAVRLNEMLAGDGVGREGWTLTESKLLGNRESNDTDWKFEQVDSSTRGPKLYEFSGETPSPPLTSAYLIPSDAVGRDVVFQRRIKAMRALRDHEELLKMIGDRRRRVMESHDPVERDTAFLALDASKQQALTEIIGTLPIYLVQGPPGVGKTFLVRELAMRRFKEEPTVRLLLTAQSNAAIDHLLEELVPAISASEDPPLIIRSKARDAHGAVSEYDTSEKAKSLLAAFVTSPLAQAADDRLRKQLVELAGQSEAGARGASRAIGTQSPAAMMKAFESVVLRSANLVFATTAAGDLERLIDEKSQFDWTIVEEAGKATGGELIAPQLLSHRRLMIGDHKQLPPFGADRMIEILKDPDKVASALAVGQEFIGRTLRDDTTDEILDELEGELDVPALCARALELVTLFETMIEAELGRQAKGRGGRPIAKRLELQHRMHPAIARIVSKCFYDGALDTHPDCRARFETEERPFRSVDATCLPEKPIIVVDMPSLQATIDKKIGDRRPRWHNPDEVKVVLDVLAQLRAVDGKRPTLAVLSPYREQVIRLRRVIDDATEGFGHLGGFATATRQDRYVETVDSFQGSEADVVIISLVRNNDHSNVKGALGFLSDFRRMNVLLSRARWQLILIGSIDFLAEILKLAKGTDDEAGVAFLQLLLDGFAEEKSNGFAVFRSPVELRGRK
ncbi:AAA domain-containing protein [Acetobacter indonesiensis]|uniref:DEAD/DEAH box helicase family protein n=1 Tax=Acetobacter indonesiensis TaxID=104101 RepID=UPI001F298A17|nr:ATP-binding protein [Acetobacter indonesiensis]MCG0995936.1 AAA domain-containing protein [Acetobacter indonesiensis]